MALTLNCVKGDLQAVKVCIAAAIANLPLKLRHVDARQGSASVASMELLPSGLTQPNAITIYLGESLRRVQQIC